MTVQTKILVQKMVGDVYYFREAELNIINQNRYGLPKPIQNSLKIMDKYIYVSLAERQRDKWKQAEEHPLTKAYVPENTPIEQFYKIIYRKAEFNKILID